ncbi:MULTISPECIES: NfeD family protein [unclassified Moraxella]|uniref:NfeD family protein n=1 Tax=unclassified Moraxella TaxID=2685852 RepID=UPI003AF99546
MTLQPWYWLILGLVLIIGDLFITSFVSLTIGMGAIITGLLAWVLPIGWFGQVVIWLVLSVIITIVGFKFIKPRLTNRTTAGLGAGSIVGETGMLIHSPQLDKLGKVRFSVPIFGADEWACRSLDNMPLAVGERVVVVDVIGNELLVKATTVH